MTAQTDELRGELREPSGKQQWGKQLTSSIFTREETFPLCKCWLITAFLSASSTGQKKPLTKCNDVSNDCILTPKGLQSLLLLFPFRHSSHLAQCPIHKPFPSLSHAGKTCCTDLNNENDISWKKNLPRNYNSAASPCESRYMNNAFHKKIHKILNESSREADYNVQQCLFPILWRHGFVCIFTLKA